MQKANKGNKKIENNYLNKKSKRENIEKPENEPKTSFRVIEPYRSVGIITDSNNPVYFKRGIDRFLLSSNEKSFLVYNLDKLRLERISPPLQNKITALGVYKNKILTAKDGKVQLWDKIHILKEFGDGTSEIKQILTFDDVLIYTTVTGNMYIYTINEGQLISNYDLNIDHFIHPTTYFNQILFSTIPQRHEIDLDFVNIHPNLILYNINTGQEIFNFKNDMPQSQLCLINQSPVIDIVGLSFKNGDIILYNLQKAKRILSLHSTEPITTMSFSTCTTMSTSLLATATVKGIINFWDLNQKKIHYTLPDNFTSVDNLLFLPNEPLLIATSGKDNAIKMYKFDNTNSTPTLLKFRTGHRSSPKKIRFYGESSNNESNHIISYDDKSLRNISIINEHMSKEFSNKKFNDILFKNNKLGRKIIDCDFNEFRERDWANVALLYSDYEAPLLYSYENSSITEAQTKLKTKNTKCLCVTISMCGNFGFCGFENGSIEEFNMQSGKSKWVIEKAHKAPVNSIRSDGINSMLISISHTEQCIKFWEILQHSLIQTVSLSYFPKQIEINRDNDLLGVALENNAVCLYDKSQIKLVREFKAVTSKDYLINDFILSKNAKWLLIAMNNKSLKIFDILSSNLIEWVTFDRNPLSLAISPNSQYIAMSFDNEKGIYLYINRTMFTDFEDIGEVISPCHCELTSFKVKKIKKRKDFAEEDVEEIDKPNKKKKLLESANTEESAENKDLIKLSNENNLKYRILNNIEIIQEKNKPSVKEKQKDKAPFFLFNIDDVIEGKLPQKNEKGKNIFNDESSPEFLNILKNYSHFRNEKDINEREFIKTNNEFVLKKLLLALKEGKVRSKEITLFFNELNPVLADLEIRSLDPLLNVDNHDYLEYFVDYIHKEVSKGDNFEMVQAFLNRFIKIFSEDISHSKGLKDKLKEVNQANTERFKKLNEMFRNTMCLISYFGQIQI